MNRKLQNHFDVLERQRHGLLEKVSILSPMQLQHAPEGKWSLAQIVAHLIAAERLSLRYMNKKILGMEATTNTGMMEEIKTLLLIASQRLPFKFKAPKVVVENTPAYVDFEQLRNDWDNERIELRAFLERFNDHQIKKKIYRHVRAGQLNIHQALIFFREHFIHHWPQIKRLL